MCATSFFAGAVGLGIGMCAPRMALAQVGPPGQAPAIPPGDDRVGKPVESEPEEQAKQRDQEPAPAEKKEGKGQDTPSASDHPTAADSSLAADKKKKKKKKPSKLIDPVDKMPDASQWLDTLYGFIPIPTLITEPALGGIGGALGLAFFGARNPDQKIPPNIYGVGGGYTANKSWFVGGGYRGFFEQGKWRVGVGGYYAAPNLELYLTLPSDRELSTTADINAFGGGGRALRKLGRLPVFLGVALSDKQVHLEIEEPDFAEELDLPQFKLNQNQLQMMLTSELDTRNNFFSPTAGSYARVDGGYSNIFGDQAGGFGSVYAAAHQFVDLKYVVLGFRGVGNVVVGTAPFYLRPFVSLRGVPVARYQGDYTFTLETEEMIRFTRRIGMVVFGGWGKAMTDDVGFKEATNVWNVGGGLRYLVARLYGLQ
ncbi:MAG TPA: hypothetical protein VN764_03635, partial [Polyangiaceae bacterium]|nr:hypothetical protein [Polyangiaceae bacterium]